MIHCWPFLEEAGTLARQNPNFYIDTCSQPILNPAFFRTAIAQWWKYVPSGKITCGHDATTVEMAVDRRYSRVRFSRALCRNRRPDLDCRRRSFCEPRKTCCTEMPFESTAMVRTWQRGHKSSFTASHSSTKSLSEQPRRELASTDQATRPWNRARIKIFASVGTVRG